eukprot:scaffold27184_cov45-Attheya_sp.AAC.3
MNLRAGGIARVPLRNNGHVAQKAFVSYVAKPSGTSSQTSTSGQLSLVTDVLVTGTKSTNCTFYVPSEAIIGLTPSWRSTCSSIPVDDWKNNRRQRKPQGIKF